MPRLASFWCLATILGAILCAGNGCDDDGGLAGGADGGGASCRTDSVCRLFSDYCTGCDCRALGVNEPDPICNGPGVQCLIDPCDGRTALCVNHRCTVVSR